jgi:hypothetical protein
LPSTAENSRELFGKEGIAARRATDALGLSRRQAVLATQRVGQRQACLYIDRLEQQ